LRVSPPSAVRLSAGDRFSNVEVHVIRKASDGGMNGKRGRRRSIFIMPPAYRFNDLLDGGRVR
jgi:hypothetical protein